MQQAAQPLVKMLVMNSCSRPAVSLYMNNMSCTIIWGDFEDNCNFHGKTHGALIMSGLCLKSGAMLINTATSRKIYPFDTVPM